MGTAIVASWVSRVGDTVTAVEPGQFVIGGFLASDNTCLTRRVGVQSACQHGIGYDGCQSELIRILLQQRGLARRPAPVRHYLPDLMHRVWSRVIDPGKVFDMELPLEQVGDAYRAMDERRAIKVLLRP